MSINNSEEDGYSTDETVDLPDARERQDLSPSSDEDDVGEDDGGDAVGDPEGNVNDRLPVQESQMASILNYEPETSLGGQTQTQLIPELIIPERIVHAPANGTLPIQETCQIGGFVLTIKEAIVEELD